jgi:hypothetical protein
LTTKPILGYPDFLRKFIIYTDASGYGIGVVLAQMQNPPLPDPSETNEADSAEPSDREVVIAYTSKHFTERVVYTSCVQLKNNVLLLFTRTSVWIPGEFTKKARVISALLPASTLPFLSLSFLCLSLNLFVLAWYREIHWWSRTTSNIQRALHG